MIREFAKLLKIDQSLLNQSEVFDQAAEATVKARPAVRLTKSPFTFLRNKSPRLHEFKIRTRQNHMLFNINPLIPA
jgi:hypothetical protein